MAESRSVNLVVELPNDLADEVERVQQTDPEFLESAARRASAFTLAIGDKKVLNLRGQSQ